MRLGIFKKLEGYDMVILMMVIALTCFGVVMVYSASSIMADKRFHDSFYFLKRQAIFAVIGFIGMYIAMRVDYHVWRVAAVPLLIICMLCLVIVFIPGVGGSVKGATRWIKLPGFHFQPAELAKLSLIIFMAYSLDRKRDQIRWFKGLLPYMLVLLVMIGLLMLQPDMGSSITLAGVAIIMLFAAGMRVSHIVSIVLFSIPLLYYLIMHKEYRRRRILSFLNPWADPENTGFQIIQSWLAFGTGGVTGQGLGEGKQKLFYLPEAHTDFILSVIGEELGFVGTVIVAAMFLLLIHRSIRVAIYAEDSFGRFLAFGIAILIGAEAFVNIAVVMGLLPTKGLALPFISYGGSSLILTLFAVGILLNISSKMRGVP
ncbi:MAG: putative lipid II flippase FtsW [Desulfuromonadales bacterium]|nr:putative lipid II flippase FtsW [Desulfuromonadales bacterium]